MTTTERVRLRNAFDEILQASCLAEVYSNTPRNARNQLLTWLLYALETPIHEKVVKDTQQQEQP